MFAEAVLAGMLHLPCPMDEPRADCLPWRAEVATAIAYAADEATCSGEFKRDDCAPTFAGPRDELAAMLIEIAFHESGLRKRIQAGECKPYECDAVRGPHGEVVRFLARSMWQIHASPRIRNVNTPAPRERWKAIAGTSPEAVRLAAQTAVRVLVRNPQGFGVSRGSAGRRGLETRKIRAKILAALG